MPTDLPALHRSFTESVAEFYHGEWMFVGTHKGLNDAQRGHIRRIFAAGAPLVLRHRGEHGGDMEAHAIWSELRLPLVDVWPATEKRARLFHNVGRVHANAPMTLRMSAIEVLKRSTLLVAAPHSNKEEHGTETWQVLAQAMTMKKPALIVWPNGLLTLYYQDSLQRVVP